MESHDLSFTEVDKVIKFLKAGKIGVMPTDTVYGIVGSALNPGTVEKIYNLRQRSSDKPFIILISSIQDLGKFDVVLTLAQTDFLEKIWPNPLSVVLPVTGEKFKYLHRGKNSLAFRMPKDEKLLNLLKQTGPLVAPSANLAGSQVAETILDAKRYFGNQVSFYLDRGKLKSQPSTIIQLYEDGTKIVLRKGSYKV